MTEGKYKEKMFPLACLDSINYIPVISTPKRNLMLLLNKKHRLQGKLLVLLKEQFLFLFNLKYSLKCNFRIKIFKSLREKSVLKRQFSVLTSLIQRPLGLRPAAVFGTT